MKDLEEFVQVFRIPTDEALSSLISAFSPPQASVLRQNWMNSAAFGNSAPSTDEIWSLFVAADFRCAQCGSQRRLTLDHTDGDSTNHALSNLKVLCFACNRKKSDKGTGDDSHGLKIYRAAMCLYRETGNIPSNEYVRKKAGVKQIGGATYLLHFMRRRLGLK